MTDYNSPQNLKMFLDAHGLGMRKKFGQNFLVNPQARASLVDALELPKNAEVWEVGPGIGAMTALLLQKGATVHAFEIDPGFSAVLRQEIFKDNPRFDLIEGDVLKAWKRNPPGHYFFGNLPYTIAAKLVGDIIEKRRLFKRMVFVVQKEAAERAAAKPGSKNYSSFSVLCASAYIVTPLQILKGASFYPSPHVDSQGVRLDMRPNVDDYPELFYPLVRGLFSSRRKIVKNNLSAFLSSRNIPACANDVLHACRIPEKARAETLTIAEFVEMARSLSVFL
ncbi:MAG: 16S rRNA (adenine(1518)-N(6)/adenine(1519)-N(6))-dimethyltransferase RsmA [Treponema sp.]|jgi:16S rRNA (adenine1518-N6/adenine1519-N6)-dimethyltransferase|nr:16S rRNA (adenine(1518)-N(6)/adenine(1519)-N(6))-dimethyltransferase RsmA [Treponema sp.]